MASNEEKIIKEAVMVNPVDVLKNIISDFLLKYDKSRPDTVASATSMIRLHTEKLSTLGDFSLVCNLNISQDVLSSLPAVRLSQQAKEIFESLTEDDKENSQNYAKILHASAQSLFPVKLFEKQNERGIGFLQRPIVIKNLIHIILEQEKTYGQLVKRPNQLRVELLPYEPSDEHIETKLSYYRALLLHNVMAKLLKYNSMVLVQDGEDFAVPKVQAAEEIKDYAGNAILQVQVISVSQQPQYIVCNNGHRNCVVKCGLVLNPTNGKIEPMTAYEYNKLRANDMLLTARHKYGLRIKCDESFMAHIERIGKAAATVDLLEVKHSSPVHTKLNGQGSTKGASFILYNSARLETLLRIFDERVRLGELPVLPNIADIDFTLLSEEEEWQLLYAYLFTFPQLIENSLEHLEKHSLCAAHLIIRYLSRFVVTFSAYYRRVRILTQPREQLLPVLFARIYLLKAVRIVLNKGLELLDIQPVNFM